MKKEKVYCSDCRFYFGKCEYKDNVYYLDSPLFRVIKKYHKTNILKNISNDCEWFVKKG